MKGDSRFMSWLFGGWSLGKLRIWPWKMEFWGRRTPERKPDFER